MNRHCALKVGVNHKIKIFYFRSSFSTIVGYNNIWVIVAQRLEHWTHDRKVVSSNPILAVASTLIRPKSNTVSSEMDHRAMMFPNGRKNVCIRN